MNTSFACKAGAVLLLALFSGNASAQRMDQYTRLPVGSSYVLAQVNSGSFGSGRAEVPVRMVEQTWKGQALHGFQTPQGTIVIRSDGAWITILGTDGQSTLSWDPPFGYSYPLEPGKTFLRQSSLTLHAQNRTVPLEARTTVEAFEDVTVPAGTFKAYRVRSTNNLGEESVNWFSPDLGIFVKQRLERTAQHAAGAGTRETELQSIEVRR